MKPFKITWRRKKNPICGRNCYFRTSEEDGPECEENCFLGYASWDDEIQDLRPNDDCPGPCERGYVLKEKENE